MKKIFFILSLFFSCLSNAQDDANYDAFLARQFLQNGEYAKAAEYYQELFNINPEEYYEDYINILLQLKDFDKAEKVTKLMYKQSENNPVYLLDLGGLYAKQNKEEDAIKQFNKTIKELKADRYSINEVALKFIKINQIEYAQKTYLKGKDILKDKGAFNLEMANLFLLKNDFNSMMIAYLEEAPYKATNLTIIENGLQKALSNEKQKDALEKELLKRTQANKSQYVYQDLLVWLYMQRKDFDAALLQAKSLDMLRNEDGENVRNISKIAAEQKNYDVAIKGYQYVVNKGNSYPWFVTANLELINVQRDQIVATTRYNKNDLEQLKHTYIQFINAFKNDYTVVNATLELSQLEALYIHEIDSAINRIVPIVENTRTPKELLSKAKIYLGDYYLIADQYWESILLYTQVEKEQKGNPIGEEAKFRNAKLSYYKGDFEWSQTQLKILKASTSELISNDAIDLSVFILDNLNSDTIDYPMLKFAKADLLRYQNRLDEAEDTLNDIAKNYVGSSLEDDILYLKYKIEKTRQNYDKASSYLQKIIDNYATDILGDNAIFYLAEIYQNYLNDDEKAKTMYEKIILEYKDSTFAVEARKRYRKLRGDLN